MKIFVLNRGSSSIKCFLYVLDDSTCTFVKPRWEALLQWKGDFDAPTLTIKNEKGEIHSESVHEKSPGKALVHLMKVSSIKEVDVVGHRIVHGGKYFQESVVINADVKEKIRLLSDLAPLHNLPELEGIEILEKLFGNTPQIAVFDTAFHHTLNPAATIYPGPYQWYEEGIRRFGFHGISFQYCARRSGEILGKKLEDLKMVVCHLGSGASLCAIKDGKSIDTTMGFTPLEGLMMDTRSGSIDPGIILYLLEKKKKSIEEIAKELYQESGLLGVSGISSDMRDIIEKSLQGNRRAKLAFEVYLHRLNSLIGSMIASLRGIDVLVFTAGIGENASILRERVCTHFSFLGVQLDPASNQRISAEDRDLSTPDSDVKVVLIHTQEAFEIARECWKKVSSDR